MATEFNMNRVKAIAYVLRTKKSVFSKRREMLCLDDAGALVCLKECTPDVEIVGIPAKSMWRKSYDVGGRQRPRQLLVISPEVNK